MHTYESTSQFLKGLISLPTKIKLFLYGTIFSPWRNDLLSGIFSLNHRQAEREIWRMQRESKNRSEQKRLFFLLKLPAIRFLLLFLHFVIFRLEMRTEPTTYNLLNTITFPEDLRQLSVEELPEVCKELRQDIIKEVSCNPGHFAAGRADRCPALRIQYSVRPHSLGCRPSGVRAQDTDRTP